MYDVIKINYVFFQIFYKFIFKKLNYKNVFSKIKENLCFVILGQCTQYTFSTYIHSSALQCSNKYVNNSENKTPGLATGSHDGHNTTTYAYRLGIVPICLVILGKNVVVIKSLHPREFAYALPSVIFTTLLICNNNNIMVKFKLYVINLDYYHSLPQLLYIYICKIRL